MFNLYFLFVYQKLSELEQEMEKHDRSIIQRLKEPPPLDTPNLPSKTPLYPVNIPPPAQYSEPNPDSVGFHDSLEYVEQQPTSFQEFYTAPNYQRHFYSNNNNNTVKEPVYSNENAAILYVLFARSCNF